MAYAAVPDELFLLTEELERLGGGDARVGEIEVIVRVSPSSNSLGGGNGGETRVHVQTDGKRVMILDEETDSTYETTATLGEMATEDDIFETIGEPAVEWFWDGFNASIIATGESGSGKTFTLHGNNFGLCGMILASIFHRRQTYEDPTAITLALSCWECRGEELVDLLAEQDSYKVPSKNATQFDFVTLHAADLRSALDILKTSRKNSVNWDVVINNDSHHSDNSSNISMSTLPNKAHGFIRIVLHNALDMRASTLHIVDCIGEDSSKASTSLRSTSVMSENNSNYGSYENINNAKITKKQNSIIAKQLLSFRRLMDELCSHKRNNHTGSGMNRYNQGSGVLTSSRETLLNKFISPLIAGNCKSFLLLTLPSLISNISRSKNILKSYCAASGIRCACVRLLDVQLQDLNFQSPSTHSGIFTGAPLRQSGNRNILQKSQKNVLHNKIIRVPTPSSPTSPRSSSPKPVWSPSGNTTKANRAEKKLNAPLSHDQLDFSNGVVPVVKKVIQHNRILYGETEDHTMKLFQRMDRQGKGYLSALDLKRGMKLIGLSLTNEQVEKLIVEMDDNGDGMVQPEEFVAAIHEGGRNPIVTNVTKSRSIPSHKVSKSPTGSHKSSRKSYPSSSSLRVGNGKKNVDDNNEPPVSPKPLWGSNAKSTILEKKLNAPLSHDKLDFSNGVVPVVKKVIQHNRILYGETEDHTMKLFQRMDRQGKGYLSALDLKRGMKLIGLSLTNEQVEKLIVEMDDNGDGMVQPEEFVAAIHEGGRNPIVTNVTKSRSIPSHKVSKSPMGSTRMSSRKKNLLSDKKMKKKKKKSLSPSKSMRDDKDVGDMLDTHAWEKNIAHILRMAMDHRRSLYGHTIKDTHTLFESLDRDGSGFLSIEEVRDGLHRLGLNFSDHDFELLVHHIHFDENQDGEIAYEEFAKLLHGVRTFKKPKAKSRLGADVIKAAKHKKSKKRHKKSPSTGISPRNKIRPDVAAYSDKVLKIEMDRQNKLLKTPKMNEETIVYDDDPPNISKLKREINGIMNDLMGPEGVLKSPSHNEDKGSKSPTLSNIAKMPISDNNDFELIPNVANSSINKFNVPNNSVDYGKQNAKNEDTEFRLKTPPQRQTYDSLPLTNPKPVGTSSVQFQQNIEESLNDSNLRTYEQKYYTLLERLKDERDLNGRLKRRTEELQDELLQRSNSYELEIDNYRLEKIEMKRRIRHLQKQSSYPDIFDEYERQIKTLTTDLNESKNKCNQLESTQISREVIYTKNNRKKIDGNNDDSTRIGSSGKTSNSITVLNNQIEILKKQLNVCKSNESQAFMEKEKLEESKRNLRLMCIKVVDLERYLKNAEKDRDQFMKRVAALEGENKALRENEEALVFERKSTADEIHAMRLYVSDVDKEKRRNDLLSRFVRKHTSDMAPPPTPELKRVQRSLQNALTNLKKQLLVGLPRSISNFGRVEKEMNNLFVEIDRLRIREQDLLDALRNVVEENEANQMGGINEVGIDGNQSYASRRNLDMANSLIIDPDEINNDDDAFLPNESSIMNINVDASDKKAMLEAQRKELTASIIDGL